MEYEKLGKHGRRFAALRELKKPAVRREQGIFLAEGVRVVDELMAAGLSVETLLVDDARLDRPEIQVTLDKAIQCGITPLTCAADDLVRLADTSQPQGILAWGKIPANPDLTLDGQRYAWLDRCSDPGNLGAIIRSLDFFRFDGLLLGPGSTDPWGPKTVRAAAGARFRLPVWADVSIREAVDRFRRQAGDVLALLPSSGENLDQIPVPERLLLVLGPETGGLDHEAGQASDRHVTIPGNPAAESLNLAVALSVAGFYFRKGNGPGR